MLLVKTWHEHGDQRIFAIPQADRDDIRQRVAWAEALLRSKYGDVHLAGRLADLDLLQRLVDDHGLEADQTYELQSLGLVVGEVLVNELGFHWIIVEDQYGRDPAIKFGESSVKAFPLTMVSKRIERGERPNIRALVEAIRTSLPKWVDDSNPASG